MIDKPLHQITYDDIDQFVNEQWPEGKTVDYKRDLYGGKDDDKKELLKDVSSFANTQGGDILIGVDEDKGLPTAIPGAAVADLDKEKLRLAEVIRRGLEPRIEFDIHGVQTPSRTAVIVIRVRESLLFPHRVVFQGKFGEFWARSSSGKYSMDTDELRRAFTLSEAVYGQIREFRQERVAQILRGETPLPMPSSGKLILHLIPVSSFRSRQAFAVASMPNLATQFPPLGVMGWDTRLNLDGHLSFQGDRQERLFSTYTQFFRNGAVEAVLAGVVSEERANDKLLLASYCERILLTEFGRLMSGFGQVGIRPPVWGFLTVTGVMKARVPTERSSANNLFQIDRDILWLPEFVIDDLAVEVAGLLRPTFDLIWNASGFQRSPNFDRAGKWVGN